MNFFEFWLFLRRRLSFRTQLSAYKKKTEVFEFSGQQPMKRIYNFNKKSSTGLAENGHFGLELCSFYVDENYI